MTIEISRERHELPSAIKARYIEQPGLTEEIVRRISVTKNEPEWMLAIRLKAYRAWAKNKPPSWGPDLSGLNLNAISYFVKPDADQSTSWDDVPEEIKDTFEKLGIPEAERHALGGVGAQFDSEVVYHNLKEAIAKQGVIFEDLDVAVQKYPDLVKNHFSKCIGINDHYFISLHYAVWSGGTFIYVPKGVKVEIPLQAYFRMNTKSMGQFEHTLIIVEEGADLHYIEGCSAPRYEASSLHAGGVEIFVGRNARCRYSSVENWSKNTYNLNTKRAHVAQDGIIEWVGGNLGSGVTMLYPCSVLKGRGARAVHLSIAFAGKGQDQDTGAKVYHLAPHTTSTITAKSISQGGGRTNYRGHLFIKKGARGAKASVECDALMFDAESSTDTEPAIEVKEHDVEVAHEARVGRISDENIFYLMSRGLTAEQAVEMIVNGFMEPITKELPLEYAVELNKLITLEIEGSLG
ncbi:Fe-S cluster assembly protein SufB [Candidatus Woesearchaeota archaeon]|nr:MAG: Fe-S cluster assembly protein SufB [Candidatus Woesearchaeota archaeon]